MLTGCNPKDTKTISDSFCLVYTRIPLKNASKFPEEIKRPILKNELLYEECPKKKK